MFRLRYLRQIGYRKMRILGTLKYKNVTAYDREMIMTMRRRGKMPIIDCEYAASTLKHNDA